MDGRPHPLSADGRHIAVRRGLCACFAVLSAGFALAVSEASGVSVTLPDTVSRTRHASSVAAVSAAVCGADRRDGNASYGAVRRSCHGGRNDRGNGARTRGADVRAGGAFAPAADQKTAFGPAETCAPYGDRRAAKGTCLSARRADRQRESASGADLGTSGDTDRPARRLPDAADPVSKADGQRDPVRRAAGFGHAEAVRERRGRLHLRGIARADRRGAGDPSGEPFTV